MEAGVRGRCEVDVDADAEGKQKGDCGKEGHGGWRSSAARCREAKRGLNEAPAQTAWQSD